MKIIKTLKHNSNLLIKGMHIGERDEYWQDIVEIDFTKLATGVDIHNYLKTFYPEYFIDTGTGLLNCVCETHPTNKYKWLRYGDNSKGNTAARTIFELQFLKNFPKQLEIELFLPNDAFIFGAAHGRGQLALSYNPVTTNVASSTLVVPPAILYVGHTYQSTGVNGFYTYPIETDAMTQFKMFNTGTDNYYSLKMKQSEFSRLQQVAMSLRFICCYSAATVPSGTGNYLKYWTWPIYVGKLRFLFHES